MSVYTIYICMCICVYVYMYIYKYAYTQRHAVGYIIGYHIYGSINLYLYIYMDV